MPSFWLNSYIWRRIYDVVFIRMIFLELEKNKWNFQLIKNLCNTLHSYQNCWPLAALFRRYHYAIAKKWLLERYLGEMGKISRYFKKCFKTRNIFRTLQKIHDGTFAKILHGENMLTIYAKVPPQMFNRVWNKFLHVFQRIIKPSLSIWILCCYSHMWF